MSNPIYNALGGGNDNLLAQLNQLRSNPVGFLLSRNFNIPENMTGNPQAIVQYLLNSGQMSQQTYNRLQSQVSQIMK